MPQKDAFAIGVLRDIYAFHRYTTNSTFLVHIQEDQYPRQDRVEHGHFTADLKARLRSL